MKPLFESDAKVCAGYFNVWRVWARDRDLIAGQWHPTRAEAQGNAEPGIFGHVAYCIKVTPKKQVPA